MHDNKTNIAKEVNISSKVEPIPGADNDRIRLPNFLSSWHSTFKGPVMLFALLTAALGLAFIINTLIFQPYQVFGESMSPTLHEGDRLIISKVTKTTHSLRDTNYIPERGEIIVFKSPINPSQELIKRVIGLPGERVVLSNGKITIFNQENPRGFNPDQLFDVDFPDSSQGNTDILLGPTEIFVSGDNRAPNGSLDSRNDLGPVPIENIVGNLVMRIFPLNKAEFF